MAPKPCLEKLDFIFILNTEEDGSLTGHVYAAAPVSEKYFMFLQRSKNLQQETREHAFTVTSCWLWKKLLQRCRSSRRLVSQTG